MLVESYYDIQKLRVETFNRIVAFVKSQLSAEIQQGSASQQDAETHHMLANQSLNIIAPKINIVGRASKAERQRARQALCDENHQTNASHEKGETQIRDASHPRAENHSVGVSHQVAENQDAHASQGTDEIQRIFARQSGVEAQNTSAEKPSVLAHKIVSLKVPVPPEIKELVWYHNSLLETEKGIAKRLDGWSRMHPLRINFLSKIQGIGPILSSGLIAWLEPISRFDNVSKLWKYCGLAPGQKRKKGEKLGYNPTLKTLMWKIARSFEKQNGKKSYYRRLYERQKKYYAERADLKEKIGVEKGAKLHIQLMTLRWTVKRFLANLWLEWRRLEGLSVTDPYAIGILNHETYEKHEADKE